MNMERANGIKSIRMSDKNLRKVLEQQLESGRVLIIEDVDADVDPVLTPVLEAHVTRKTGGGFSMMFPDKEVDCAPGFWVRFRSCLFVNVCLSRAVPHS